MLGGNILGGPFYMYHPIIGTYYVVAFNGEFGNPGIDFDSSINANPNVLINLSSSNAIPIDEKYFENESVTVQELILTQDLSDTICDSLGVSGSPINPVFALYDGIYWIHDPRFVSHRVLCGAIKCVLGIALILVFLLSLTGNNLQRGRVEMVDWGAKASGSVNEH